MHRHRLRVTLAMVGLVALSLPFLTAADAPDAAEGEGEANASLLGAALEVSDLDGLTAGALGDLLSSVGAASGLDTELDLGLLDGLTHATTYGDPDAEASMVPYRLGDDRKRSVSAGPGESRSAEALGLSGVSALLSGANVSPFTVSADADEDGALALIDAVTASLDVLGDGALALDLSEVRSEVTRADSLANQELRVDGLSLSLGDILPEELLELLPLDALLDLIEELDALGLLQGVDGLRGELDGAVDDVADLITQLASVEDLALLDDIDADQLAELIALQDALGELGTLETTVDDAVAELTSLIDAAEDLLGTDLDPGQTLDDLLSLLDDDGTDDSNVIDDTLDLLSAQAVSDVEDDLTAVLGALTALEADGVALDDGCTDDLSTDPLLLLVDAQRLASCIDEALTSVDALVDGLVATITSDIEGLDDLLGLVLGLLDQLDVALGDLLGVVDDILGNADDIAGLELVSADEMVLDVVAAADANGGATDVTCQLGGLSVLGQALGDASCDDGALIGPAAGAVDGALGTLTDVLGALPGVDVGDGLRLDLLPESRESVTTLDDGTVVATAHAVLLDLGIPSVTIDPTAVVDDLLDLPSLPGQLLSTEGEVGQVLGLLDDPLLGEALDGTTALLDDVSDLLDDVTAQLGGVTTLLDGLDLPVLSQTISTPQIDLVLDPTSEARFTAAQAEAPTDPSDPSDDPEPSSPTVQRPAPDPATPELPKTGGAFSLLGLLALAGAAGLRRTG